MARLALATKVNDHSHQLSDYYTMVLTSNCVSSMYTANKSTPEKVTALSSVKIVGVTAGSYHTCAITDTGVLYCWGYNTSGQVGRGNTGR